MKRLFIYAVIGLVAISLYACGGGTEEPAEPSTALSVDKTQLTFDGTAGEQTLTVSCSGSWTASVYAGSSWLSISQGSTGSGNGQITLKATANDAFEERKGGVTVMSGDKTVMVSVTQGQKAKDYRTLKQVRALYKGTDTKITDEIYVSATVISNYIYASEGGLNNATSLKTMVVADDEAGLQLYCAANNVSTDGGFTSFKQGDVVELALQNQTLSVYSEGVIQVNGMPLSAITKTGTTTLKAKEISAKQLLSGEYESMYVSIPNVQVVDEDLNKTFVMGGAHTSIGLVAQTKETFEIFTSKYASFGSQEVPSGSGTVKGIAGKFGERFQVSLAYLSDVDGLTGERFYSEPTFKLSALEEEVYGEAGELTLSVSANVSWTAVSSLPDNFTVSPASADGSAAVTVSYTQNPSHVMPRTVQITFTTEDTSIQEKTQVFTITQLPYQPLVSDAVANWMELPKVEAKDGFVFITHDAQIKGQTERNYSIWYDTANFYSQWVAYPLYSDIIGSGSRTDKWEYDPKISKRYQPELYNTYTGSFSRGHQLPSADRLYSPALNESTFYFPNLTAQNSDLNGGVWMYLESKVRTWAKDCDTLYVVTGALAQTKDDPQISYTTDNVGKQVAIPKVYYKALLRYSKASESENGGYRAVCFMYENRAYSQKDPLASDAMTVNALEELTGFDFFHNLPDNIEDAVESKCTPDSWALK